MSSSATLRLSVVASLFVLGCSESPQPAAPEAGCAGAACDAGDAGDDLASFDGPTFDIPDVAVGDGAPAGDVSPTDASDVAAADAPAGDAAVADVAPPPCPLYQARCNGACVDVSGDPANCGSCGATCPAGRVCVAGACAQACPGGLTACGGRCVDAQSDSAHCGACGARCDAGMGCVAGRCARQVFTDPSGAPCAGGGAPVELGGGRCAGAVAETSFRWAICSCSDLRMTTPLVTDGFDSTGGGYAPGGVGAGVGVNATFSNTNTTDVGGALWVGGAQAWGISAPQRVRQVLKLNASFLANNGLTVGGDAYVNGDARGNVPVAITETLHVPAGATVDPMVSYRRVAREPVTVEPPCDCSPATLVPVAALVAEGRTRNDNARIGLDSEALVTPGTDRRLDLPCGRYYISSIGNPGSVTIVAHGRTALFIGGDVAVTAPIAITLDEGAELDLVIGGSFRATSTVALGSPARPALTRVYIAGAEGFRATGTTTVGGNLYLPGGTFDITTPLEVWGSVFAGSFRSTNTVSVHYDRGVLRAGDTCRNPPPTPGADAGAPDGGGTDAGGDGGTPACTSCRDCANQACVGGRCGACRGDGDCCAPLQCWMGRCVVIPG
ncbi:MAG: hypothetical protein U0324_34925 [Polyangiales bacterium]